MVGEDAALPENGIPAFKDFGGIEDCWAMSFDVGDKVRKYVELQLHKDTMRVQYCPYVEEVVYQDFYIFLMSKWNKSVVRVEGMK